MTHSVDIDALILRVRESKSSVIVVAGELPHCAAQNADVVRPGSQIAFLGRPWASFHRDWLSYQRLLAQFSERCVPIFGQSDIGRGARQKSGR